MRVRDFYRANCGPSADIFPEILRPIFCRGASDVLDFGDRVPAAAYFVHPSLAHGAPGDIVWNVRDWPRAISRLFWGRVYFVT